MPRSTSPGTALFAGWLVPGGGHFLLGRRTQGVVFFVTVTLTFLLGMFLTDFRNVSPTRHQFYFLAHVLNGGETIAAAVLTSGLVEEEVPRHFGMRTGDIGTLYSAVAGLLNVIVMMDAFGIAAGIRPKEKDRKKPKDGTPVETEAPAEEPAA